MEELGLYVNSLIYGFDFEENDEKVLLDYRKSLEESINLGKETLDTLYEKAKKIDPKAAENISKTDKKRIFRILEIYYLSHIIKTEIDKKRRKKDITKNIVKDHSINDFNNLNNINFNNKDKKIEYKLFYIDMDREKLYSRINKRVDIMLELGLVEETKNVIEIIAKKMNRTTEEILEKYDEITSLQAIGYREIISYLKNEITFDEMKEKIKQNTRRYAKRQITWFKKNKKIILDRELSDEKLIEIILENIKEDRIRRVQYLKNNKMIIITTIMLIIVMTILVNAVPKLITFIVEPAQKFMVSVRKTFR